MDVQEVVRKVRDAEKFTQAQLGKRIGVSQTTISNWQNGRQQPRKPEWDSLLTFIASSPRSQPIMQHLGVGGLTWAPLISWDDVAGLIDLDNPIPVEDAPLRAFADLVSGDYFALQVKDDAMDRDAREGAVILVNREDRELVAAQNYIFLVDGQPIFRSWGPGHPHLVPNSIGGRHGISFITKEHNLRVVGRVVRSVLDL